MHILYIGLLVMGLLVGGCNTPVDLKKSISGKSIGILSIAWYPAIHYSGETLYLGKQHTAALSDTLLRGLGHLSGSWVRDRHSSLLQDVFLFYPDIPPPKQAGLALGVLDGYKWVDLTTHAAAKHWCDALGVDMVMTLIVTPTVSFEKEEGLVLFDIIATFFDKQTGRLEKTTLQLSAQLSKEDTLWGKGNIRRIPDLLRGDSVLRALSEPTLSQQPK